MTSLRSCDAIDDPAAREEVLRRQVGRWRLAACCLVSLLAGIGGTIGATSSPSTQAPSAGGAPAAGQDASPKLVAVVLDPSRSSGRWSSTMLALDSFGRIWSLDTSRATSRWMPFQYSP